MNKKELKLEFYILAKQTVLSSICLRLHKGPNIRGLLFGLVFGRRGSLSVRSALKRACSLGEEGAGLRW
jgi:hypothetical protein